MDTLPTLVEALHASRGFAHKQDIGRVLGRLGLQTPGTALPNGDDCAVLPDPAGDGHLLLAIEGLVADFARAMPWFAGWSGVMVNLSDVAAMGGRPLAVVDALWSGDAELADEIVVGMQAAAERFGVPLVGGHTNLRAGDPHLAVAVLGRARRLVSSFAARPGDRLMCAVDLRGRWMEPYAFWNAATEAPAERLRGDLALLPALAEDGLVDAGKDISMAGLAGTLLMLCECSRVGARLDLAAIPQPPGAGRLRWLGAFPSFGYLLSVRPAQAGAVRQAFESRGIACADVGEVRVEPQVTLVDGHAQALLWDFDATPFITRGAR